MQKTIFYDSAGGSPLFTAVLPESAQCRAQLYAQPDNGKTIEKISGEVSDPANRYELFFQSGDSFTDNAQQQGQQQENHYHPLCQPADQLNEYAAQFLGQTVPPSNLYYLPKEKTDRLTANSAQSLSRNLAVLQQVGQMGGIPINVQCTGTIVDGAMGVYPFVKDGQQKTLYSAIWRIGLSVAVGMQQNIMGGFFNMGGNRIGNNLSFWNVPFVVNMVYDGPANDDTLRIFTAFIATFEDTPELKAYGEQVEQANLNADLQKAYAISNQNQAEINMMWQQHNAAWARTEAMSKSMSEDMDRFRAGLAANSASMDAFHNQMHSMNSSSGSYGTSYGGESLDDKVQRWRHESMMGVNTYERGDGSTYEHSIQADRVFENNLDSNTHFGTQNYYDDYVPDGWTELNRKK